MSARVAALYRHPVKGFTPEPIPRAALAVGETFPCDRLYAVEDGPSGFAPAHPAFVPKQRFTVLAKIPEVAKVRTRYDDGLLKAEAPGASPFAGRLDEPPGRAAFADWLGGVLGENATGPLKVIEGPGAHRFTDHPQGHVSILNLATVRRLSERTGRFIDPLRFRANVLVEGWAPWSEMDLVGSTLRLGDARATVFKPIVRCAATEVDPDTGVKDFETVRAIFEDQGHMFCGLYLNVVESGDVGLDDAVEILP
jgi:uncharacterized protein YcbX